MTASKKTDNHSPEAKLELRRHFLSEYHSDGLADVLDCCMATGFLWSALRKEFTINSYLGLDIKPKKGRLQIDSARYLAAGGWNHNVIDIDTYGSPWAHWMNLLKTGRESMTIFLTIGKAGGMQGFTKEIKLAMGIEHIKIPEAIGWAIARNHSLAYLLSLCLDRFSPIECIEAESNGNARYIGIRLLAKTPCNATD